MRQGQQNKRPRGRSRKQHNSANRSFESNGPDVKIRGNASHVAEKYVTLARDALASGDTISGENYLQHAEHYFRIMSAAAAQQQAQAQAQPPAQSNNQDPAAAKTETDSDDQPSGAKPAPQKARAKNNRRDKPATPSADLNGTGPADEKGADTPAQNEQADSTAEADNGNGTSRKSEKVAAEKDVAEPSDEQNDTEPAAADAN